MPLDDYKPNSEPKKYVVDAETERTRMAINAGTLGRFFGAGTTAARNIAGTIALLLLVFLIVFTIVAYHTSGEAATDLIMRMWGAAGALLTGALGFLFGAASKQQTGE